MEFNQLAMANAEGLDHMLNRVMPKDNIGLAALLQTTEAAWENSKFFFNCFYYLVINFYFYCIIKKLVFARRFANFFIDGITNHRFKVEKSADVINFVKIENFNTSKKIPKNLVLHLAL